MNAQNHVDMDTLNMLKEVMEDGFCTLLETYIDDSKVRIEEIKTALSGSDADSVRRAAHSLKGSSGNLGATNMAALCLQVEEKGREGNLDDLDAALVNIETEYLQVVEIMQSMLTS